jgi:glycosyltransferase involved in cell wall biosynthesis
MRHDGEARPMNVAHVITRLIIGGAQENTLLTVEEQHRAHGDEVTLITGPALGPEGSLLERARRGGFRLIVLNELRRSVHPWRDWKACRALKRVLREKRPEIVHTHSSKAGILGRVAASRLGLPVVHTIHGAAFHYGQSSIAYAAYRGAERWAASRTDHFISVADAMTDEYVQAGVAARDRFTTIYSGFDVEPFLTPPRPPADVRREWGFGDGHVVVGKIGRLFHLKGQEFLIAAAPEIVRRHPNVRFVLVGDGMLRETFARQIAELGLTERFHFTGLVPPERIPELIHGMDIVAHASQWEGLARVLPQALIAGKPVVSFDVGGAREVVIPGETGFVVPLNDVGGLVDSIDHLAADAELRRRMGAEGRARFAEKFRYQFMAARIRDVYEKVLCNRVPALGGGS